MFVLALDVEGLKMGRYRVRSAHARSLTVTGAFATANRNAYASRCHGNCVLLNSMATPFAVDPEAARGLIQERTEIAGPTQRRVAKRTPICSAALERHESPFLSAPPPSPFFREIAGQRPVDILPKTSPARSPDCPLFSLFVALP